MARKKQNPLSGSFRDPPQDEEAHTPGQDVTPAEQGDTPAEPVAADAPTPEQEGQGMAPAEQGDTPAEPVPTDGPAPEQDGQDAAPAEQGDTPADPVPTDGPTPEQDGQDAAPAEQGDTPAEPVPTDGPTSEQDGQDAAPAEQGDTPAEPVPTDGPAPEQDGQDVAPAEQGDTPAEPVPTDGPAPDEPEASVDRLDELAPNAQFVMLEDIKPLPGTYVKDTPRDSYIDLFHDMCKSGMQPIILRKGEKGDLQLVDGFHRCKALEQNNQLQIQALIYDMPLLEASRYRRDHHTNPDLPIPGKLIPKEMPEDEKAAQDEEEFVVPKDFTLPIAKEGQREIVTTLKVADIHPFEGHPFNVLDNKDMWELRDSVKQYGVMEPVMVINRPAGGYEMVSGHRRLRACQLAGIQTIPALVRNLDRDEATIAMVDANLKREEISPMEKARAYKMKTDAMRRKVGRRSKTEAAIGEKPLTADQELAKQVGESVSTVQRYKQLNDLIPEMQEMVDKKQIPLNTGADISRMKPEEQKELLDAIKKEDKVPTGAQVKELKKQSEDGTLTAEAIKQSVAPTKREEKPSLKITLGEEDLRPYFPDERTTVPDVKKGIFEALALWQKALARQQAEVERAAAKPSPKRKDEATPPATPTPGDGEPPAPPAEADKGGSPDPPPAEKPADPKVGGRPKEPAAPASGKKPAVGGKGKRPAASTPKKANRGGR